VPEAFCGRLFTSSRDFSSLPFSTLLRISCY
jgi:hypothetical protein